MESDRSLGMKVKIRVFDEISESYCFKEVVMRLKKLNEELLKPRLMERNLFGIVQRVLSQRKRHSLFSQYFTLKDKTLGNRIIFYHQEGLRIFIDSSRKCLKAVDLHNGN